MERQADCDSGAGHLPAIIEPKIVRHTIILSANDRIGKRRLDVHARFARSSDETHPQIYRDHAGKASATPAHGDRLRVVRRWLDLTKKRPRLGGPFSPVIPVTMTLNGLFAIMIIPAAMQPAIMLVKINT
jgi:hypothetical protein